MKKNSILTFVILAHYYKPIVNLSSALGYSWIN